MNAYSRHDYSCVQPVNHAQGYSAQHRYKPLQSMNYHNEHSSCIGSLREVQPVNAHRGHGARIHGVQQLVNAHSGHGYDPPQQVKFKNTHALCDGQQVKAHSRLDYNGMQSRSCAHVYSTQEPVNA